MPVSEFSARALVVGGTEFDVPSADSSVASVQDACETDWMWTAIFSEMGIVCDQILAGVSAGIDRRRCLRLSRRPIAFKVSSLHRHVCGVFVVSFAARAI